MTVAKRTNERRVEVIAALRRLRLTGLEIAECLQMPHSTVSGILTRVGMGKLGRLGLEPAQRYERERPGELIYIDVKKLGRIRQGAGKRITGIKRNPHRTQRDATVMTAASSAGSTSTSRSTTRHVWPTSKSFRRESHHRDRVPTPGRQALRDLRHHNRATDHR